MIGKYLVDAGAIWGFSGQAWTLADYFLINLRSSKLNDLPPWLCAWLIAWTLPFIWVGVSMTLRRAVDAGRSPWWFLAFFVPGLNYAVMLWLSFAPTASRSNWNEQHEPIPAVQSLQSATLGFVASIAFALICITFAIYVGDVYGLSIFVAVPLILGISSGFAHNRRRRNYALSTVNVALLSLLLTGGVLILFALEGLLCILLAIPISVPLAVLGALLGRAVAIRSYTPASGVVSCVWLFPAMFAVDQIPPMPHVNEVRSEIFVNASVEGVWENVIKFDDIEAPPALPFRLGIAYPIRARIEGTGVGATRYCEFSTGSFIEPITIWSAPHRLAFDVIQEPPVLQEWSPYKTVYAPHINGFFSSKRGEFRLRSATNGMTVLEGSTWYTLKITPTLYWKPITDWLVGKIHERVLIQIRHKSEHQTRIGGLGG